MTIFVHNFVINFFFLILFPIFVSIFLSLFCYHSFFSLLLIFTSSNFCYGDNFLKDRISPGHHPTLCIDHLHGRGIGMP